MTHETDWLALWRDLAEAFLRPQPDPDARMVERYRAWERNGTVRPDSLLDVVVNEVGADTTVLDVGAGTGRWTIPLARVARRVTAIEPTAGMEEMLRANLAAAGVTNVAIVPAALEDAVVEPHDVVVAAHSMYTSPDLAAFVGAMERHARAACFMELHLPPADGVIGELTRAIHGRFYDSPNALIALNALHSLGICANLLVEDEAEHWTDETPDEALERARRHLRLDGPSEHDELIRAVLAERLTRTDAGYRWPDGKRAALLWWRPGRAADGPGGGAGGGTAAGSPG